jgi:hypothetical protein
VKGSGVINCGLLKEEEHHQFPIFGIIGQKRVIRLNYQKEYVIHCRKKEGIKIIFGTDLDPVACSSSSVLKLKIGLFRSM